MSSSERVHVSLDVANSGAGRWACAASAAIVVGKSPPTKPSTEFVSKTGRAKEENNDVEEAEEVDRG